MSNRSRIRNRNPRKNICLLTQSVINECGLTTGKRTRHYLTRTQLLELVDYIHEVKMKLAKWEGDHK